MSRRKKQNHFSFHLWNPPPTHNENGMFLTNQKSQKKSPPTKLICKFPITTLRSLYFIQQESRQSSSLLFAPSSSPSSTLSSSDFDSLLRLDLHSLLLSLPLHLISLILHLEKQKTTGRNQRKDFLKEAKKIRNGLCCFEQLLIVSQPSPSSLPLPLSKDPTFLTQVIDLLFLSICSLTSHLFSLASTKTRGEEEKDIMREAEEEESQGQESSESGEECEDQSESEEESEGEDGKEATKECEKNKLKEQLWISLTNCFSILVLLIQADHKTHSHYDEHHEFLTPLLSHPKKKQFLESFFDCWTLALDQLLFHKHLSVLREAIENCVLFCLDFFFWASLMTDFVQYLFWRESKNLIHDLRCERPSFLPRTLEIFHSILVLATTPLGCEKKKSPSLKLCYHVTRNLVALGEKDLPYFLDLVAHDESSLVIMKAILKIICSVVGELFDILQLQSIFLIEALRFFDLCSDDSNFKNDLMDQITPNVLKFFSLPPSLFSSFTSQITPQRGVAIHLFRVCANLHCYNPSICLPQDRNRFCNLCEKYCNQTGERRSLRSLASFSAGKRKREEKNEEGGGVILNNIFENGYTLLRTTQEELGRNPQCTQEDLSLFEDFLSQLQNRFKRNKAAVPTPVIRATSLLPSHSRCPSNHESVSAALLSASSMVGNALCFLEFCESRDGSLNSTECRALSDHLRGIDEHLGSVHSSLGGSHQTSLGPPPMSARRLHHNKDQLHF